MTDQQFGVTTSSMNSEISDLRSAIAVVTNDPTQYLATDVPVDSHAQLAGVYRHVGAGGTVARPTRRGPAMMFQTIVGFPNARVLVGLMADRRRVARLLGTTSQDLARTMVKPGCTDEIWFGMAENVGEMLSDKVRIVVCKDMLMPWKRASPR